MLAAIETSAEEQCAVIKFLLSEGVTGAEIRRRTICTI
jgi:hypothetical protein